MSSSPDGDPAADVDVPPQPQPEPASRPAPAAEVHDVTPRPRREELPLAVSLFVLAGGLALNTVFGPLLADVIRYGFSQTVRNQTIGLELISLVLVAPLCVVAGLLVLRRRPIGAVLAIGPAAYVAYMFVQYVIGPGYDHYPGVLLFHLALFVLSGVVLVTAWRQVDPADLPLMTADTARRHGALLYALAAFIVLRYVPAIVGSFSDHKLPAEFAKEPAMFWSIVLLDLGIVVPITISAGLALRRGAPNSDKLLFAVAGWFALVPPSVAAMGLVMVVNDDPHKSIGQAVVFVLAAAAFTYYAVRLYRSLWHGLGAPAAVESPAVEAAPRD